METFTNEIRKFAKKHEVKLLHHGKVEAIQAIQMLDTNEQVRRLKKKKKTLWAGVVIITSRAQWSAP